MLIQKTGDVFTSELPAVAHGVNTHGVMGSGIAVAVKKNFPQTYQTYRNHCLSGELQPGMVFPSYEEGKWVLNLASQDKPGANARIDWLEESLVKAATFCEAKNLQGFAAPRIGAGIGGLEWEEVLATFEKTAERFPGITIELWTYDQ